jgi:hypothetical protein
MVPSGSARVELVQRATTFALIAALKAQDNPTKLNLAGMRWPNPPPKRDIRDLHQFSFFSYEKWSKMSAPAPLRRPYLPCRSRRCELGTRRMAKYVLGPPTYRTMRNVRNPLREVDGICELLVSVRPGLSVGLLSTH